MPATILIADDYEDNRELLRIMLSTAQYEVREAANGQQCLAMAKAHPPDLILVDLNMPLVDGWDLVKEIKADQNLAHIPCIAVSAYTELIKGLNAQSEFSACLTKPFRREELLETVARVLASASPKTKSIEVDTHHDVLEARSASPSD